MSANGISHLSTKQQRQVAKLDLAQEKRQSSVPGRRELDTYHLGDLPANYSGNVSVPTGTSLRHGRPWRTS